MIPGARTDSQNMVHGCPASASPGHWLGMQILESHSRCPESETLHVGPSIWSNKHCSDFDAHSKI